MSDLNSMRIKLKRPKVKQRRSVVKRYAREWAAYWELRQAEPWLAHRPPFPPRQLHAPAAARLRRRIARGERL